MNKYVLGPVLLCALYAQEPRRLWTGDDVNLLGGPSKDGKLLSFVDPKTGNLALRDLGAGTVRRLTSKPAESKEFAYFSTISPDSQQVSYAWFNEQSFYDLRVVDLTGKSRILFQNEEAGFIQPCAWSPDGKQILTLLFRKDNISQIALVPSAGGPPRILKSLNWVYPKKMDFSPDGKYIVYDTFLKDGGPERALFILAADGSSETRLTDAEGSQLFPLWSPDGKFVYFAGDSSGAMEAFRLRIVNGRPSGAPVKIASGLGRYLPLGITSLNDLIFGSRMGGVDVLWAPVSEPEKAVRVSKLFPGLNSNPAFSPDGKTLAYLSRRGAENFGEPSRVVVLRKADGSERELASRMAHIESVKWSHDGGGLLVSGSDRLGRAGLFLLNPAEKENQNPKPLIVDEDASFRGVEGASVKDGVVYIKNGKELRHRLKASDELLYKAPNVNILRGIAASADGSLIAMGYGSGFLGIRSNGKIALRKTPLQVIKEVAFSQDAAFVSDGDVTMKIPLDFSLPVRIGHLSGIAVSPDGQTIAFTSGALETSVWSIPLSSITMQN